jgi:hypothetical protein
MSRYVYSLIHFGVELTSFLKKNRPQEFGTVSRIWRHLAGLRRSGQAHSIDELVPHRRPHSITIRCPCCPEVGLNVDLETIQNASEDEAYVSHILFFTCNVPQLMRRRFQTQIHTVYCS